MNGTRRKQVTMTPKEQFKRAYQAAREALRECEPGRTFTLTVCLYDGPPLIDIRVDRTEPMDVPLVQLSGRMAEAIAPAVERRLEAPWLEYCYLPDDSADLFDDDPRCPVCGSRYLDDSDPGCPNCLPCGGAFAPGMEECDFCPYYSLCAEAC